MVPNTGLLRASSRNFGNASCNLLKSRFCTTNCTGNCLPAESDVVMVCSWMGTTRAAGKRLYILESRS